MYKKNIIDEALLFARYLGAESRKIIKEKIKQGFSYELKPDGTFVTNVDFAVEDYLRSLIKNRFPDHDIIGEEFYSSPTGAPMSWIIDPIDGTHSFRHKVPLFGTIITLLNENKPIVGLIDLPMLNRCYYGAKERGTFMNGQPVVIKDLSMQDRVDLELIATGDRVQFENAKISEYLDIIYKNHKRVRTYTDCFGHAMAIEGAVGAMIDADLKLWDVAATLLLVKEAGGIMLNILPGSNDINGPYNIIFGKPRVVKWVASVLGL